MSPSDQGMPQLRLVDPVSGDSAALFHALCAHAGDPDDALAEFIEADARARLSRGDRPQLRTYLSAIPDLRLRRLPLDAAIDMALRAASRTGSDADPIESLIRAHPDLERPIRDAAALSAAMWSTEQTRSAFSRYEAALPCAFGRRLPTGEAPYTLLETLGVGASGQVFLARDTRLSDPERPALVAIKVLHSADPDPWARKRLVDEAAKARRIEHPNVVRVLHSGVSEQDEDYIVYECIEGLDLGEWALREGLPLPVRTAAELMRHICAGVQAAHSAGLAHCDLKPANILITADGSAKITDFGIAVRTASATSQFFNRNEPSVAGPAGTLAFMAPEQYRMEDGAASPPADMYALGGLLFWLMSGRLPNGDSPLEVAETHDLRRGRNAPPSLPPDTRGADADLRAILARALAPRADDRYASAAALGDDLRAWLAREPISWTRPSPARVLALWSRRRPGVAILTGALACTAVVGAAVSFQLSDSARRRATEAQIANARKEAAELGQKRAAESVPLHLSRFRAEWERSWAESCFVSTHSYRDLFGPAAIDSPQAQAMYRDVQCALARDLIDDACTPEGAPTLGRLVWQVQLAFWLITDGQHAEPIQVLRRAVGDWAPVIGFQDPYVQAATDLLWCAEANRVAAAPAPSRHALEQVRDELNAANARWQGRRIGGPLRALVLDRLALLNGPTLLNDPLAAAGFQAELATVATLERYGVHPVE